MEPESLADALGRLRRVLRRVGGSYALVRVVVDDAARGAVLDTLREALTVGGPARVLPAGPEGAAALEALLREQSSPLAALVVPDADALLTFDEGRVLAGLNLARDRLGAVVAGPLVLVLSPAGDGALAMQAPDLRDATLGVVRVEAPPVEAPGWSEEGISYAEVEAELARILAADLPDAETVDALLRLSGRFRAVALTRKDSPFLTLLHQIGREAETRARRCGYVRGQANAMVLLASSDIPGAEDLLRQSIALLGGLGLAVDIDRAWARAVLAHRLANATSLEESVRLFREDVLPEVDQARSAREQFATRDLFLHLLITHGRHRQAAELALLELVPIARAGNQPRCELDCLSIAASQYVFAGDDHRAIALLHEEVLPRAHRLHREDSLALAYRTLTHAHGHRGGPNDQKQSLLYADLARRMYLKLGNHPAAAEMEAVLRAHNVRAPRNRAERRHPRGPTRRR